LIEDMLISCCLLNEFIKGKLHSNKFEEIKRYSIKRTNLYRQH